MAATLAMFECAEGISSNYRHTWTHQPTISMEEAAVMACGLSGGEEGYLVVRFHG